MFQTNYKQDSHNASSSCAKASKNWSSVEMNTKLRNLNDARSPKRLGNAVRKDIRHESKNARLVLLKPVRTSSN